MRTVIAIVVQDGEVVSCATNEHKEPCKREGYPTGEGYELCKYCQYENHAEFKAVQGLSGGTVYLIGHTYACEPCKTAIEAANMKLVVVPVNN